MQPNKDSVSVSEMVRTLRARNYAIDAIAQATGLPVKHVKQIISDETPSIFPERFKKPS